MNFVFAFISLPFSMVQRYRSGSCRIKSFIPARTANCPMESDWRANPACWHGGWIVHQDDRQRSEAELGVSSQNNL
jgi:hypothetical protein